MADEKNKKGLGRGLMSLFGDEQQEDLKKNTDNKPYLSISIGNLVPNRFQPRNYFNDQKINELAQSIKKKWINSTNCSETWKKR